MAIDKKFKLRLDAKMQPEKRSFISRHAKPMESGLSPFGCSFGSTDKAFFVWW